MLIGWNREIEGTGNLMLSEVGTREDQFESPSIRPILVAILFVEGDFLSKFEDTPPPTEGWKDDATRAATLCK
jgi:hypothetical protein